MKRHPSVYKNRREVVKKFWSWMYKSIGNEVKKDLNDDFNILKFKEWKPSIQEIIMIIIFITVISNGLYNK
tara:strand:+ start:200 stop:412 length:213 start_codon:yes stop_codon:yes gene_type:complete